MSTKHILSCGVATLLALAPRVAHAVTQTITASGDPLNGNANINPAWGTAANWSGPNGATLPGVADIAQITYADATRSGVDIRGSGFVGNVTEVAGVSFVGTAGVEVDLENSSTGSNMTLSLNGAGGTVPLIQTGGYFVQIANVGFGTVLTTTRILTLQLRATGEINVGSGGLTIGAAITQSGGVFSLNKTGPGILTLNSSAANGYTGTMTITAGTLIAGKSATNGAITGNLIVQSAGTFQFGGNNLGNQIADNAAITINGGNFGDLQATPTNPGAAETVSSVTLNGGNFSTGRAAFTTSGAFNVTAGTALVHRGGTLVGTSVSIAGGVVNLDGGSTTAGGESKLNVGATGLTLTGGTINFDAGVSALGTTSTGSILNLAGNVTSTGASSLVHLNPGTVGPKALVDLGGGTRTFNVTGTLDIGTAAAQVVVANGGVTKTGAGTLTLGSANTFAGAATVSAGSLVVSGSLASGPAVAIQGTGTLVLNGSLALGRQIAIATGGTLSGTGTMTDLTVVATGGKIQPGDGAGTGTLTLGSLNLGQISNDLTTLAFTSAAQINVTTTNGLSTLGGAGKTTVNIIGAIPALGQYVLVDYAGAIGGAGFAGFTLGSLPAPRITAALVNNAANTSVDLNVTVVDFPIWKGAQSSEWSTATITPAKNWVLNSNNATGTDFLVNDSVTFNDLATGTTADVSVANVAPSSVIFANDTKDFTITGTKAISGVATFTKNGTGKVTINNTNSLTGALTLNAGTVSVASVANSGANSPLGAGTGMTMNGGTLEFTGANGSTDRAFMLNAGGGTVQTNTVLTLAGAIGGAGALTKTGTGTLVLTGANNYGDTTITAGTLQVGAGGSSGSLGSSVLVRP